MEKTNSQFQRLFLIQTLPEPLTPASSHIQIFDNYIPETRLRLRKIRDPYSKSWTHSLQRSGSDELHLDPKEYAVFERFEGREIRKNRYFHDFDRVMFTFDVYLGPLWGLSTAGATFESTEAPPPFAIIEVTGNEFFDGRNLVEKTIDDVKRNLPEGSEPDSLH